MRKLIAGIPALFLLFAFLAYGQAKKAPDTLVFKAKTGDILFNHKKHTEAVKGDCKTCHPALWPDTPGAPLNYKAAMHKTAEKEKTSCAHCHNIGGKSFVSTGNCKKCHGTAPKA